MSIEHKEREGRDYVRISFKKWHCGQGRDTTLYHGPINPTNDELIEGLAVLKNLLGPLGREAVAMSLAKAAE